MIVSTQVESLGYEHISNEELLLTLVELGHSCFVNLDFKNAENYYLQAERIILSSDSLELHEQLHSIYHRLIRICIERSNLDQQHVYENKFIQYLLTHEPAKNKSKYLYMLGLEKANQREYNLAKPIFNQAILKAQDNKPIDKAYAHYGLASCEFFLKNYHQAILHVEQAEKLTNNQFSFLTVVLQLLRGLIYRESSEFKKAIHVFNQALETAQKEHNWVQYFHVYFSLAKTYQKQGNTHKSSQMYRQLNKLIQHTEMIRIKKQLMIELSVISNTISDIKIDINNRVILEKSLGKVRMNNCFVLMDILTLLAKNIGSTFSKEQLAMKIWNEEYKPLTHDNKIYYNINRLRNLIEPKGQKGKYISTKNNGYSFNPTSSLEFIEVSHESN